MEISIICIALYLILGICYAIDFFYKKNDNLAYNNVELSFATTMAGLLWPIFIVMIAMLDLLNRGD